MLSDNDEELIAIATEAISQRYRNRWQEVGAAMRTRDGRIVTGVNIDAYVGRNAVCAEAVRHRPRHHRNRGSRYRDHRRRASSPSQASLARSRWSHPAGLAAN